MKKSTTMIIAAGLLCMAPLAQACGGMGGPQCGWMWQEMDSNKDGAVSKKEFDAFHADHFKQMDANKDGKITQDEMDAMHGKMMDKCPTGMMGKCPPREKEKCKPRNRYEDRFKEVDVNGDGQLSKDEAEIGMPMVFDHFDEMDANKDGKISREELDAGMQTIHQDMRDKCPPMKGSEKK